MSLADDLFINMCKDIIDNGYSTEGEKVRPKWEDGTYAYTIKRFGVVNRYDLSKEFPAITLRKTYVKSAIDELLWIWQKKSNNVHDLKSHIWDSWADENGSIGKAYGYQLGVKHKYKEGMMDQVDRLIYDLKNNPYSRRMLTNIYVHQDLSEMNLYPCAYSMTFNVTGDRLNAILNQRSQDVLAANNWNVVQYAVLVHMLAQVTGFKPGELVHVIADAHIYDRHIPIVKELITRPTHPAPKFYMNPDVKDFYDFTLDDLRIEDYETGPQIKNIPIAISDHEAWDANYTDGGHIKFIAAVDKNWAIGNKGRLLIRISEDQRNFRQTTMGHVVVLGRKTLEEFPGGRPLKGRANIILSRNPEYAVEDAVVVHSMNELFTELAKYDTDDIFVIGGQTIYDELIPYCDEAVITKIDREFEADAFISNLDKLDNWDVTDERPGEDVSEVNFTFVTYKNSDLKK